MVTKVEKINSILYGVNLSNSKLTIGSESIIIIYPTKYYYGGYIMKNTNAILISHVDEFMQIYSPNDYICPYYLIDRIWKYF